MSLLSQLLKSDIQRTAPANPANQPRPPKTDISRQPIAKPANPANPESQISNVSNFSRGADIETDIHARLLALAESEGIDAGLVHNLTTAGMDGCAGLPDDVLSAFLHARQDTADRDAGRLPASYTARALCSHCGPVWLPPAHVTKAPTVGNWPRVLGCPWCHVHLPDNVTMPRPPVTSATCTHWTPDTVNPDAGMGHCACGHHYPDKQHRCAQYTPGASS